MSRKMSSSGKHTNLSISSKDYVSGSADILVPNQKNSRSSTASGSAQDSKRSKKDEAVSNRHIVSPILKTSCRSKMTFDETNIWDLPPEILTKIFDYLSPTDRLNFSLTCHALDCIFSTPAAWHNLTIDSLPARDQNLSALQKTCSELKTLTVRSKMLDQEQTDMFIRLAGSLPKLACLNLTGCIYDNQLFSSLLRLKHLRHLNMGVSSQVLLQQLDHR